MEPHPSPAPPGPASLGLFVSTDLECFEVADPGHYSSDLQVDDRVFRILDPAFYAWLRSRIERARRARDRGKLAPRVFDVLRARFNRVHDWAVAHLGEPSLLRAVKALDPAGYCPPVPPEPEDIVTFARSGEWGRSAPAPSLEFLFPATGDWPVTEPVAPEAIARVDAIRDKALALGWTLPRLYQNRGRLRFPLGEDWGLAPLLGDGAEIVDVAGDAITLRTPGGSLQKLHNPEVDHPWCSRVRPVPSSPPSLPAPSLATT